MLMLLMFKCSVTGNSGSNPPEADLVINEAVARSTCSCKENFSSLFDAHILIVTLDFGFARFWIKGVHFDVILYHFH